MLAYNFKLQSYAVGVCIYSHVHHLNLVKADTTVVCCTYTLYIHIESSKFTNNEETRSSDTQFEYTYTYIHLSWTARTFNSINYIYMYIYLRSPNIYRFFFSTIDIAIKLRLAGSADGISNWPLPKWNSRDCVISARARENSVARRARTYIYIYTYRYIQRSRKRISKKSPSNTGCATSNNGNNLRATEMKFSRIYTYIYIYTRRAKLVDTTIYIPTTAACARLNYFWNGCFIIASLRWVRRGLSLALSLVSWILQTEALQCWFSCFKQLVKRCSVYIYIYSSVTREEESSRAAVILKIPRAASKHKVRGRIMKLVLHDTTPRYAL